jgi:hypothetical protein
MRIGSIVLLIGAGGVLALNASCSEPGAGLEAGVAEAHASMSAPASPSIAPPGVQDPAPRDYHGIHNAVSFHPGFISGSVPEGDAGFDTLAGMGVKTIISVDGAAPEVDKAAARGMRYIHLPIGYNGFDEQRRLQLVRATRDAMAVGPVYIHCHHGKHRSAGAAASIAANLGWASPQAMIDRMKVAGTAPNYTGLYACATNSTPLAPEVIDAVPADFPSVWRTSDYVRGMVEIDEAYEHLKAIEKAGWKAPADHPDLVPAAEAGRLADLYRVLLDTDRVRREPAEFADLMRKSQDEASALERMLSASSLDPARLSAQFKIVGASCKQCHTKYRD